MLTLLLSLSAHAAPDLGVGARYRYIAGPDWLADRWLHDGTEFDEMPERPPIRGHGFGLDVTFHQPKMDIILSAGWVGSTIEEGYFDDREEPPDYFDGDWIRTNGFGITDIAGAFAHRFVILDSDDVDVDFLAGGGIGLMFFVGEIENWDTGVAPNGELIPAWERLEVDPDAEPDETWDIPRVLPVISVVLGPQITVVDRVTLRLEGGLHTLPYLGVVTAFQL